MLMTLRAYRVKNEKGTRPSSLSQKLLGLLLGTEKGEKIGQ